MGHRKGAHTKPLFRVGRISWYQHAQGLLETGKDSVLRRMLRQGKVHRETCPLILLPYCRQRPTAASHLPVCRAAAQQRPAFLMWHNNALVFKGEETADEKHFAAAVAKLSSRMDQAWDPALPVGAKQPCMLAYVAAGSKLQFFCVKNQG